MRSTLISRVKDTYAAPSGPMLTAAGIGWPTGISPSGKYECWEPSHTRRWIDAWRLPSGIRTTVRSGVSAGWPPTVASQSIGLSVPGLADTPSIALVSQKPEPSDTQMSPSGSTMAPDGSVSPVATTVAWVPAADAAPAVESAASRTIGKAASATRRCCRVRFP